LIPDFLPWFWFLTRYYQRKARTMWKAPRFTEIFLRKNEGFNRSAIWNQIYACCL